MLNNNCCLYFSRHGLSDIRNIAESDRYIFTKEYESELEFNSSSFWKVYDIKSDCKLIRKAYLEDRSNRDHVSLLSLSLSKEGGGGGNTHMSKRNTD